MKPPSLFARGVITIALASLPSLFAPSAAAQGSAALPQPGDDVTLRREPPFDRWCVAPLCKDATAARPALLKVPAALSPDASQGLLEERLKRALVDALEGAARTTLGPAYNEAVADLAEALAATVSADGDRLARAGGLGAAVVRAGLTYHVERGLPPDAACTGPRRFDAIYEGLAVSVALGPLEFPKKRGRVPASCAPTAQRTARLIDEAVLRAVTPEELRRDVEAAARALEDARRSCAGVPGALAEDKAAADAFRATTVGEAARALRALGAARSAAPPPAPDAADAGAPTPPSPVEQACAKSMASLRAVAPQRLEALASDGLADAPLASLVASLRAPALESMALVVRLGSGATGADDVRALVEALVQAAGLPVDAPLLKDAIAALPQAITLQNGSATLDPNALLAILTSRYGVGDDGKPSLRSLLGLQPTPWVLELNGGIPNVDFSQSKVVADMSFGYATKKLGLVGRGWIDTYNIDDAQTHSDYTHAGGALEGFWLSGDVAGKLRVELRLAGGFDYYDTTTYPKKDALSNFYDFDSRMVRGTLSLGVRYGAPGDRVSGQLLAGGGVQFEDPDTTRFSGPSKAFGLTSDQNLTGQASARLLLRVHVVPQIVGVRLRADSTYFSITREELAASITGGQLSTTSTVAEDKQIEVHARLFVDADVASFAGFVPAVFGGVDYVGIQGTTTSSSTLFPVLGAGIMRQTW